MWMCLIVPAIVKLLDLSFAALGRVMVAGAGEQAADLIQCQFSFLTTCVLGNISGWIIYASPTFEGALAALLGDIVFDIVSKVVFDRDFRLFIRHAFGRSSAQIRDCNVDATPSTVQIHDDAAPEDGLTAAAQEQAGRPAPAF